MKFCIITPHTGLRAYAALSDRHLLLPQLCHNRDYKEFYKDRQSKGDLLILDNGAYEGRRDWDLLHHCLRDMKPDVCVLPDYLLKPWQKTHKDAVRFMNDHEWFKGEWMYVPQAPERDAIGYCEGLQAILTDQRVTWIGLSKILPLKIMPNERSRIRAAEFIQRKRPDIKIHALGLMNGSLWELQALRESELFESVDSNAPVWRGYCHTLMTEPWFETPVDYDAHWDFEMHDHIKQNLTEVGIDVSNLRVGQGS